MILRSGVVGVGLDSIVSLFVGGNLLWLPSFGQTRGDGQAQGPAPTAAADVRANP